MKKKIMLVCLLAVMFVLLTGCEAQKDGETTILVESIEDGENLQVTLQVNTKSGKEWLYIVNEDVLTRVSDKHYEGWIVANKKDTYVFEAEDTGKETLYCILLGDEDYDNAKVYEYSLTIDDNAKITVDSKKDYLLSQNAELRKQVKEQNN
ncbi:MAG: hypothetical protein IJN92_01430 [Lachnospiraceae bacterium]|nr:hypothetical protein [Lachnospiraceae bacterium]